MLKKLRWRVILAAMTAFLAIIVLIAVLVNLVNYFAVTNRADQTLSYILKYEKDISRRPGPGGPPPKPFMEMPDLESNYMTRFFIIRFDTDGTVVSASTDHIASVEEADVALYAKKVLERRAGHGYIKEYRYMKETVNSHTVAIFLNTAREQQFMKSLFALTVVVSGGSLVLVFVLVFLFSGKATKPIIHNIERQKQFITDASHELKTPLTSISTSIDVISLEYGENEWTDNIRNQTGRMSKLVSELVMLSRLDEEIPLPNKEHFSLSNAAWEIVEVYQPQAKARGKNLHADILDNVSLFGEKAAIWQMLSVLMDNAIRYSDANGDIRLTVSKKRNKAQIEVFNTCEFLAPPDVMRLFDRFYRPDSSRNSGTGGSGVGLAIAKAVAQTHGGTIAASCPSGKTMTIKITI